MKLSTRVRYGARAMVDLAAHYGQGPTSLKDVCERQGISRSYMENLIAPLRAAGLVRTHRGYGGGYVLAKEPSRVTLGDVVRALEGSLAPVLCVDDASDCRRAGYCATRLVWQQLADAVGAVLDGITLEGIARTQQEALSGRAAPAGREEAGETA